MAKCGVVCFRWQSGFLYVSGGKVSCWVFYVAICVDVCFGWQCVLLGLVGGNVCFWVF